MSEQEEGLAANPVNAKLPTAAATLAVLQTQLSALQPKAAGLVTAYEAGMHGVPPNPYLITAPADVTAAQGTATALGTLIVAEDTALAAAQAAVGQLTGWLGMIYDALGLPATAQPAQVLAAAKAAAAGKAITAPAPAAAAAPPAGFVSLPVAAGLALGALVAGGLGGWAANGKFGGAAAKKNPLLEAAGPKMEVGYALKFDQGQWSDVMIGQSVVAAAKFVGYQHIDGDHMAMFRTPSGKVYAQTAVGPRAPAKKKTRELPAREAEES